MRRRRGLGRMAAAIGAATLVAGCGGGGGSASPTTAATSAAVGGTSATTSATAAGAQDTTAATQPPVSANPGAPRRGTLVQVVAPTVSLNGQSVSSRTDLRAGDALQTLANGEADFALDSKVKSCTALKGTRLTVAPDAQTLVRWDEGSSICVTTQAGTGTFGAGTRGVLTAVDPVFEVSVGNDTATIKVDKGFVSLAAKGRSGSMIVGFGEQATLTANGPEGLGPWDVAGDPAAPIFRGYERQNPVPSYTRPGPASSAALQAIFQRGRLLVSSATDPQSEDDTFARTALTELSGAWGLRGPQFVSDATADIAVTTRPGGGVKVAGAGALQSIPFFNAGGATWSLVFRSDAALAAALRSFVSQYLNRGDYGAAYGQVYGDIPRYDALRSVLFG